MSSQALGDYKDLLCFLARLPDQAAPIVVECLTHEMDNLWEEMTEEECEEARNFSLQRLLGGGE